MDATGITEAFSTLETHVAWRSQLAHLQDAYNASPMDLGKKSPLDDVRRQVAYLEARDTNCSCRRVAVEAEDPDTANPYKGVYYIVSCNKKYKAYSHL